MDTRRGCALVIAIVGVARTASADDDIRAGVTCVDATSGAERWRTSVADGRVRLRLDGDTLWEGRAGEAWRRHDLRNGQVVAAGEPDEAAAAPDDDGDLWTTTDAIVEAGDGRADTIVTTGAFVDDLAVVGDLLAFALDKDDGEVHGWNRADATPRWVLRPRDLVPDLEVGDGSRVEVLGERLLVYAPPALLAVDPDSGAAAWVTRVPALEGRWGTLRAIELGALWIVTVDGVVVGLDATTGQARWSIDAGAGAAASPVAAGTTACFDRRDEDLVPYARDEAEVSRSLAITVAGGVVTAVRWVLRATVPAGATRTALIELPVAIEEAAASLTLRSGDTTGARDLGALLAADGVRYLDVAGPWEEARIGLASAAWTPSPP